MLQPQEWLCIRLLLLQTLRQKERHSCSRNRRVIQSLEAPIQDNPLADSLTGRLTEVAQRYQRVLEQNPHEPQALLGMSLVALASRQPAAAVQMAQVAVDVAPGMGPAWVTLGQALRAASRSQEAEEAYANAIRLDGMDALARMGLGELKIATDRAEEAILEFELALQRNPLFLAAHLGLGHALACLNRFQQALDRYEHALSLNPKLSEAEFAAGFSLNRLGRPQEAERRYRRALSLRPDFAAAWMNLGCLLRDQGRELYAKAALVRAVELRPDLISGWINLALLERDLRNFEKAEAHLRKAFELNPDAVETHVAWAQFCTSRQDRAGAWGWLRWALARNPNQDEAVNCWGILLHNDGRFAEAVEVFRRAEELGNKPAASNRGNSLLDLGDIHGALQAHTRAVELDPHSPGTRYNLALTQLRVGDWANGWPGYEARWSFREVHRRPRVFDKPRWNGEPLQRHRVLLHAEQGLGDTIQFCRYAALVAARGGIPVLQVQDAAERLVRSLPVVRAGQAEVAVLGGKLPAFDLECPLMSLPAVFGATIDTTPSPGPYLFADPDEATRKWEQFPARPGTRLRVGLTWAGNPRYKADRHRSTRLETLLPLLRTPGVTWISLQKGEQAAQLAGLPEEIVVADGSSQDRDLAETSALVDTLDLVISTDTCIPHLAGAMGKPVWLLLPHLSDWRWMQKIETTPWYPAARLIRQTAPQDWDGVIARASEELIRFREALSGPVCGTAKETSQDSQGKPA
jgi:tetratricopeptide (TPR) repeat protein